MTEFAKEIIENGKYIHPSKQGFLENLLRQLQARLAGGAAQAEAAVQQQQVAEGALLFVVTFLPRMAP